MEEIINSSVKVGDKVEFLTHTPDTIFPTTPMINYRGRKGRVIRIAENGNFRIVIDHILHEVEFRGDHLRVVK